MSRTRNAAIIVGLCVALAACDDGPTAGPTAPPPAVVSDAGVQSLSDSWVTKRSLSPNRTGIVAAAINGRIYVAGGEHSDWTTQISRLLSRVDVYDVATNTWSRVAS